MTDPTLVGGMFNDKAVFAILFWMKNNSYLADNKRSKLPNNSELQIIQSLNPTITIEDLHTTKNAMLEQIFSRENRETGVLTYENIVHRLDSNDLTVALALGI